MTKKEIVRTISEELNLTQLQTKKIVQKTFDAIVETLVTEGRIELRNFGVFEVKKRAARKARNPKTGDQVEVAEKFVVTFKPGKTMEEKVRLLEERELQAKASGTPTPSSLFVANATATPAHQDGASRDGSANREGDGQMRPAAEVSTHHPAPLEQPQPVYNPQHDT